MSNGSIFNGIVVNHSFWGELADETLVYFKNHSEYKEFHNCVFDKNGKEKFDIESMGDKTMGISLLTIPFL